ncbi:FAD binding domain protein [Mycobacterium kansasii 824]|nr:FAD binding domain protein [Mycobacterium kansasii 824]
MSRLADRAVAAFGTALLPPEHGGPAPAQFVERVGRYVEQLPATQRFAVRAGVLSLAAASYLTTGRSLPRLNPADRARVLGRIAAVGPDMGAAVEGLKAIVLLANGADAYADELLARAQGHDPARPDAALTVTSSTDSPAVVTTDAVIVGSGAGGAMAARTLARAGLGVVVLEEGRRWTVEEFRTTHPIDRYAGLYRGAGATIALGRPSVVLPMGRAVGGTTVVNSGTCFRPPDAVQRRWRHEFGLDLADPDRLACHLDEVERTLQVAPAPLDIMGRNGNLLLDAATALGWRAAPIPRNAPGCGGCCQCAIGCPRNAKFGVHLNALPQACAAGARIVSRRAWNGCCTSTDAPAACAPAGPTAPRSTCWQTPSSSPPAPPRRRCCCGAAVLAAIPGSAEPRAAPGDDGRRPVRRRRVRLARSVAKCGGPRVPRIRRGADRGDGHATGHGLDGLSRLRRRTARLAGSGGSGRYLRCDGCRPGRGSVRSVRGEALVRYDIARADIAKLRVAMEAIGRLLFEAGAAEVLTGLPGATTVTSLPELREAVRRSDPASLHLAAFHPTGTAAAGADPQICPVDPTGRLRGVDGVWVADASILPSCAEVNPQVSIMALALAVADQIVARR